MNKLETLTSTAMLPLVEAIPQLVKEETIFSPIELTILKSGITAVAAGYLLYTEVLRQRQVEPLHEKEKNLSKAGMALITVGVGASLYALWKITPF